MTPGQIELARPAMALPGFKVVGGTLFVSGPLPGMGFPREALRSSAPTHRVDDDADDSLEVLQQLGWIIHFDDPTGATDGVLLRLLGPGWLLAMRVGRVRLTRAADVNPRLDDTFEGATLAEACCRAALALGRWPGGSNV